MTNVASEETALMATGNNNNNNNNESDLGSQGSTEESYRLWEELDRPWPATFDRSISLLASPVTGIKREQIALYTHSPKPGSTPLALQRRRSLSRGFYSPEPRAVVIAARRKVGHVDADIADIPDIAVIQTQDDLESRGTMTMNKMKSLDFGNRVDVTTTRLAAKAQQAKEYRQQILKGASKDTTNIDTNKNTNTHSTVLTDSERQGLLRSPGYAKEMQSLRFKKQQSNNNKRKTGASGAVDSHGAPSINKEPATVLQSAFNLANILMGVGLLGLPYGFKIAGYWGGFACVAIFGVVTWRTSILIGRQLNGDPKPSHAFVDNPFASPYPPGSAQGRLLPPITGFPDIARRAFGDSGCIVLSILLYFELFSCVCIFFVAIGDHLHSLFPQIPLETHTILAATISLVPTIFLRTPTLLSYFSMVGTLATIAVVLTVVVAALAAGSQVDKLQAIAGTEGTKPPYVPFDASGLIMCLGLVAYCFSGHAIVPSIYTTMKEPQRFEEMVTITFVVVMLTCFAVAISGYYMFGTEVADQVTLSLEAAFSQNGGLMDILIWLMVLTAFSKTTLTIFPLALGMEEIAAPYLWSDSAVAASSGTIKFLITACALLVSLYVPSFSFLCALTGMICTMAVSVIFPAAAHSKIFGKHLTWWDHSINGVFVVLGIFMAIVGTIQTL